MSTSSVVELVDVSRWQHPSGHGIDWQRVRAAGIVGAYVKATEAKTYRNPSLAEDVAAARAAGLEVGAYLFQRGDDGAGQGQAFLAAIEGLALTLPPAIDVEVGHSEAAGILCDVLATVEPMAGTAVIYTYEHFQTVLAGRPELGTRLLWLAAYHSAEPVPAGPWAGRSWWAWQWTGKGRVDGIGGDVDRSRARWVPHDTADDAVTLDMPADTKPTGT